MLRPKRLALKWIGLAALVVVVGGKPSTAKGDLITSLFNTGVDASGAKLPDGTADPHYTVTNTDTNTTISATTLTVDPSTLGWAGDASASRWISPTSSGVPASDHFTYTTTFSLAGFDPSTAMIHVSALFADDGTTMFLNGLQVGGNAESNTPWVNPVSFDVTTGFIAGTNTLTFVTPDTDGGPGGLQVEMVGTASVPEPSTLCIALPAAFGMILHAWRKSKHRAGRS